MTRRQLTRRQATSERKTAYHEGGHSVVAIELKIPFTKVDIIEDDTGVGHIHYKSHTDARTVDWLERRIIVALAGGMAERRYAPASDWRWGMGHEGLERDVALSSYEIDNPPEPTTFHVKTTHGSDLYDVNEWLYELGRDRDDAYRADLEARARALVRKLWPQIQIVAAALLKRKRLTQWQVRKLMADARHPRTSTRNDQMNPGDGKQGGALQ
jgi:hypothetical protein